MTEQKQPDIATKIADAIFDDITGRVETGDYGIQAEILETWASIVRAHLEAMNGGAGFRIKAMAAALQHEKHVEAQAELLRSMEAKS
jgi:hypothetical protein